MGELIPDPMLKTIGGLILDPMLKIIGGYTKRRQRTNCKQGGVCGKAVGAGGLGTTISTIGLDGKLGMALRGGEATCGDGLMDVGPLSPMWGSVAYSWQLSLWCLGASALFGLPDHWQTTGHFSGIVHKPLQPAVTVNAFWRNICKEPEGELKSNLGVVSTSSQSL